MIRYRLLQILLVFLLSWWLLSPSDSFIRNKGIVWKWLRTSRKQHGQDWAPGQFCKQDPFWKFYFILKYIMENMTIHYSSSFISLGDHVDWQPETVTPDPYLIGLCERTMAWIFIRCFLIVTSLHSICKCKCKLLQMFYLLVLLLAPLW